MHPTFLSLPQDLQLNTFSLLNREELILTIPQVCKRFKVLSEEQALWNRWGINRENFKRYLNLSVPYTNQIAMRHLIAKDSPDYQKIKHLPPFEQRSRIFDFLARRIQEYLHPPQSQTSFLQQIPFVNSVCSKVQSWWNYSTVSVK